MRFPLVFIDRLLNPNTSSDADGLTTKQVHSLLADLESAGARTPGLPGLLAGMATPFSLTAPYLPVLGDATTPELAAWMQTAAHHGSSSLWCVRSTPDSVETDLKRRDIPLVLGHGVLPVLRGPGEEPLTSLSVSRLRRRLDQSRAAFTQRFGFPPTWIMPPTPIVGRATDDLVRRELREAGFRIILEPARAAGADCADIESCTPEEPIIFRTVGPSDDIPQLRDWVLGEWRARSTSRFRQVADTPGRIARRLLDHFT